MRNPIYRLQVLWALLCLVGIVLLSASSRAEPGRVRKTVKIPKEAPYTTIVSVWHDWEKATLSVTVDSQKLAPVTQSSDLKPDTFFITDTGALQFHETQQGKSAILESQFIPLRVAVFVTEDPTGSLYLVLADRLRKLGDEPFVGAEVQAALVKKITTRTKRLANYEQLAEILKCSRLIVAQCKTQKYPSPGKFISAEVRLDAYNLDTGDRMFGYKGTAQEIRMENKWLASRRRAMQEAVNVATKEW